MKRHPLPKRLLAALMLPLSFGPAVSQDKPSDTLADTIRHHVAEYGRDGAFVGAVTLVGKEGRILDIQAHGVRDLDSTAPMTPDSIFKIHSFTKAITSTAALMLFDEGKYQFDDPVSKWIPEFGALTVQPDKDAAPRPAAQAMRVGHLFTHTSGLTYRHRDVFDAGNLEAVARAIAATPLSFEPGQGWEYGVSIDVLGRLVEIWSGQPIETFFRERLFDPLAMMDTAFHVPPEKADRRVTIYNIPKDKPGEVIRDPENDRVPSETPLFCMPGGGLYSTATDYFKFLRMIENGAEWEGKRYLKPETRQLMVTNQVPENVGWIRFGKQIRDGFGYGFGFNTVVKKSEWDPDASPGECGWGGKASCHYWFHPKSDVIVITLEQIVPYRRSLEVALKGAIYEAL